MQGRRILVFTETFSFRPLQQGKDTLPTPRYGQWESAYNEFRETSPEMNLKNFFYETV